jgi:[ribosomal protein S18]-alanine N-acetyltransferase
MELEDIPAVAEVERQSFSTPWPVHAYRRELKDNRLARYMVARRTGPPLDPPDREMAAQDVGGPEPPPRSGGWLAFLRQLFGYGATSQTKTVSEKSERLVGYSGLWLMVDEAHITSIAVAPRYRGLGVGELLLVGVFDVALGMGAQYVTLEVRASNTLAQNLYRKYTFKETGVRRRYYSDNNEDALIMWSDPIDTPAFRAMLEERRRALIDRLLSPQTRARLRPHPAQG